MSVASISERAAAVPHAAPLSDWIAARQARFEQFVQAHLLAEERDPRRLHAAMRYAVLNGGKRVRPLLVYAAGEFGAAADATLDPIAAAIEFVHAYSLVHDDLPCMDDDVLRRGKPTVHVAFDEATADGFVGTDEASLAERSGHPVAVVMGSPQNIKITTKSDLFLADAILKAQPKPKVAGPIHPFAEEEMWK